MINVHKNVKERQQEESTEKYPWVDPSDESTRQIEKY